MSLKYRKESVYVSIANGFVLLFLLCFLSARPENILTFFVIKINKVKKNKKKAYKYQRYNLSYAFS